MGIIFLISFAHQPLTMGLVYGDPSQRDAHRRFYLIAPLVGHVLILIGLNVSLTLVGLMAGLWNAEHTLMQRYGVLRIYGRKAGDDHGRFEKPMLVTWLVAALLFLGCLRRSAARRAPPRRRRHEHARRRAARVGQSLGDDRPFWIACARRRCCSRCAGCAPSGRRPPSPPRRAKWPLRGRHARSRGRGD